MTETQETPAAMLLLAPSSKAADILGKMFELRKDGAARAVLAQGARANEALRAALAGGVSAVVLMSPPAVEALDEDIKSRLRDIAAPILALFGTEDSSSPVEFGHAWRRALPKCFQTFVFDAGADMANERPAAVASLVAEFLTLGEGFLVNHGDGRALP